MFSSDRRLGPVYQWTILTLLGLVYFLTTATTFTSLGVVLPGMLRELNWSWTDAGFGFTLLGLTCGLSSFLPSLLIRKTNVRLTLLAGCCCFWPVLQPVHHTVNSALFYRHRLSRDWFYLYGYCSRTYVISRLFSRQSLAFGFTLPLAGWAVWSGRGSIFSPRMCSAPADPLADLRPDAGRCHPDHPAGDAGRPP